MRRGSGLVTPAAGDEGCDEQGQALSLGEDRMGKTTMEFYRIRVKGRLGPEWSTWFEGLSLEPADGGCTTISGYLPDQAALHGVLARIRDLGLPLVALQALETPEKSASGATE